MMKHGSAVAQRHFHNYLTTHEQDFLESKESVKKAITADRNSFVMAQMDINMDSGCTEEYTRLINETWHEMLAIHLSLTTMQLWDLNYRIRNSQSQADIDYLHLIKDDLFAETQSDAKEFKKVIKSRSCPAFTMSELLGKGCAASVTYPGQEVQMECSDPNKSLILASTNMTISSVDCESDSNWSVDVNDLVCLTKCNFEGKKYTIGEKRKLPDPSRGHYWADQDGNTISETTCIAVGKKSSFLLFQS
jgi:hypothetical protein